MGDKGVRGRPEGYCFDETPGIAAGESGPEADDAGCCMNDERQEANEKFFKRGDTKLFVI